MSAGSIPSAETDGGRGSRIMRGKVSSPTRAARIGTRSATCRAPRPRIGVDADDLVLDLLGLAGELLLELGAGHHWASSSSACATRCWSAGGSTLLASAICVKVNDRAASMIAPANASRRTARTTRCRVHAGGFMTRSSEIGASV